jgi:hypothetical protein
MGRNPAKPAGCNRKPAPRAIRAFSFDELDAIAVELPLMYRAAAHIRPPHA